MGDLLDVATRESDEPSPVRILVVDDRPENLLALAAILEAPGRALVLVRSGREALRELLRQPFALILLDVNMPEIDGFETAELVRQRPASAHTPIIFLTADHDEHLATRSYALGAVDFISTPVNPVVLKAKTAVFVELYRKTEENRRQAEQLRLAEERLRRRAEQQLREVDQRLRLTVESVSDYAIFSLDAQGRIATWNAGATRLFGLHDSEAIGNSCDILFPPDARPDEPHWVRARAEGRTEVEAWFDRQGSGRFFGRGVVTVMRSDSGEIVGYSKVVQDVTARKQTEEALARQAEQLREANRLKDEFLAVLSHELRTPLNAIIGWTHMLRRDRLDPAVARQALEAIARNGEAQLALVNDILDVSRFMAGKLRLEMTTVDLREAVRAAAETGAISAKAKGIDLQVDAGDEPITVSGDPDRLRQIVWNLVSNAVKFTPAGGHVRLAVTRCDDSACVTVSDDGIGVSPEFLPHVFERFRQADSSSVRAHGGLGLGLAIVRHLVELHGGIARAQSEGEGRGSTFEVVLPALSAEAARNPRRFPPPVRALRSTEAAADRARTSIVPGVRCLVVDDDPDARQMLKTALERRGMIVTVAESASAALGQISSAQLLLADIAMPGEDGYSLIRRVRALPADQGGRVPAVALTAYASARDRELAIEAGFDRHIAKPVEHPQLFETIAELLGEATTTPPPEQA